MAECLSNLQALSAIAEKPCRSETGSKIRLGTPFQHLLKQAQKLKDEEASALRLLLELLAQVPVIRGVEPVLPLNRVDSGIDALVWLQLEDRQQPLACAVLANGQPRHVRLALCKEHEVAFMDQQGNARLVFDGVFTERVTAGQPVAVRRELKSLFTPQAAQVLRLLLRDPWRPWRVAELAEKVEVSLGQVSNVRGRLLDREWATVTDEGLKLKNPHALLDAWSEAYAGLGGKKKSYYTTLDLVGPTPEILAQLALQGRGEEATELREEVLDRPPSRWYQTGFLIPSQTSLGDRADDTADDEFTFQGSLQPQTSHGPFHGVRGADPADPRVLPCPSRAAGGGHCDGQPRGLLNRTPPPEPPGPAAPTR